MQKNQVFVYLIFFDEEDNLILDTIDDNKIEFLNFQIFNGDNIQQMITEKSKTFLNEEHKFELFDTLFDNDDKSNPKLKLIYSTIVKNKNIKKIKKKLNSFLKDDSNLDITQNKLLIKILKKKINYICKKQLRLLQITYESPQYYNQLFQRLKYLRIPLGIQEFQKEDLQNEKNDVFLGLFDQDEMLGGLIFVKKNQTTWKMRQVWIKPEFQNQGLGTFMICQAEKFVQQFKIKSIKANARKVALNLYTRQNYEICSKEFLEVGIPHFQVIKNLNIEQLL